MPITDPMRQFDSRTVRRKIKSGRVSEDDYKEFLTTLPDVSDNIKPRDDGGDEDGYEERLANRGRSHEPVEAAAPAPTLAAPASEPDDDPFADAPAMSASAPAPSPSAPVAPSAPVVPAASKPLPTPSFDLPPLDPPTSPSSPSSDSSDDGE